jgi:pre-mRNA-processing factor 39
VAMSDAPTTADAPSAAPADAAPADSATEPPPAAAAAAAEPAVVDDAAIKAAWLEQQRGVFEATKQRLAAVQGFEEGVRRPYWHHQPLDGPQLSNWVAYLDWQQQQGDVGAMQRLFERCLVPCANYPGVWGCCGGVGFLWGWGDDGSSSRGMWGPCSGCLSAAWCLA